MHDLGETEAVAIERERGVDIVDDVPDANGWHG